MSTHFRSAHARRAALLFGSALACAAAVPSLADASAVNLATATPFVVLGGSGVSNTGPSVLDGDLGVATGTSLSGFGLPAVVNGATHDDDSVAAQAQDDLSTAYSTAAGQPVPSGNVLTGQDLGGLTLTPGAYSFASSAQLTGTVTLNAEGDPNAQFVFEVGSALTTASASSVVLINGASPCNVYWQIGSSATLGTSTSFAGNVLADTSITMNSGGSVDGRLLASTGAVTLDDDTIDNSMCTTASTTSPGTTPPPPGSTPPGSTPPATTTPSSPPATPASPSAPGASPAAPGTPADASATSAPGSTPASTPGVTPAITTSGDTKAGRLPALGAARGSAILQWSHASSLRPCNDGFTVTVSGREIKRVIFTLDGRLLANLTRSPFRAHVGADFTAGRLLRARISFTDATRTRTLTHRYAACAAAAVHPIPAGSTFAG